MGILNPFPKYYSEQRTLVKYIKNRNEKMSI